MIRKQRVPPEGLRPPMHQSDRYRDAIKAGILRPPLTREHGVREPLEPMTAQKGTDQGGQLNFDGGARREEMVVQVPGNDHQVRSRGANVEKRREDRALSCRRAVKGPKASCEGTIARNDLQRTPRDQGPVGHNSPGVR